MDWFGNVKRSRNSIFLLDDKMKLKGGGEVEIAPTVQGYVVTVSERYDVTTTALSTPVEVWASLTHCALGEEGNTTTTARLKRGEPRGEAGRRGVG